MPEVTGLDLQQVLAERGGSLPIVFLTGRGDIRSCAEAMKEGAVDFLTKPVDESDLLAAVSRALERAAALQRERGDRDRIESALAVLTPREREVLEQVVAGRRNKQIACRSRHRGEDHQVPPREPHAKARRPLGSPISSAGAASERRRQNLLTLIAGPIGLQKPAGPRSS